METFDLTTEGTTIEFDNTNADFFKFDDMYTTHTNSDFTGFAYFPESSIEFDNRDFIEYGIDFSFNPPVEYDEIRQYNPPDPSYASPDLNFSDMRLEEIYLNDGISFSDDDSDGLVMDDIYTFSFGDESYE